MIAYQVLISGDVVGVGYRSWMRKEAQKLGIVGWVRNREDKTVEAAVQGTEENITNIIGACHKGPEVAWVEKVTIKEIPVDHNLITFEVIY